MSKVVRGFVMCIALGVMVFAGYQLANIVYNYASANEDNDVIAAIADSPITEELDETEFVDPNVQNKLTAYAKKLFGKAAPGRMPITGNQTKASLAKAQQRRINFPALKKKNKQIIAWIYVPNMGIDYAVTKASDNKYYLKRNALKKPSSAGAIFMDAKARADFEGMDSPVYGHHMRDKSMFGSLPKFRNASFRKKHQYIYVYTPQSTKKYKLSSQFITNQKQLAPNTSSTKILTLVTCEYTSANAHYVVRAKLVSSKAPGAK